MKAKKIESTLLERIEQLESEIEDFLEAHAERHRGVLPKNTLIRGWEARSTGINPLWTYRVAVREFPE